MAQSQKDEDNVQRSTLTLRKDVKVVKAGKPVPAAGEGDDEEHAQGTETWTEPSPDTASWMGRGWPTANHEDNCDLLRLRRESESIKSVLKYLCKTLGTIASWMGREWPTAHRKDDCDFPDQPTTSKSDTQRRKSAPEYACNVFRTWSAAAVWIMMALTVATSSLAGAECIGTEVKLDKGEAVLRCPLPVDVSDTHRGIIVKHFPTPDSAAEVLFCYWSEETGKPECESSDSFSLEGQLTDQVVAKVPVSRLMDSGAYKCQLYPPDYQRPFTPCHIHRSNSDNDEGSAVAPTPVAPSITTKRSTPGQDPLIREPPPCVGQSGSVALTAAVLVLQVIIMILLVVNVFYLQKKKNLQKPVMSKRTSTSSNQTPITTEYHSVSSESETATSSNQTSITMDYHSTPSEEL